MMCISSYGLSVFPSECVRTTSQLAGLEARTREHGMQFKTPCFASDAHACRPIEHCWLSPSPPGELLIDTLVTPLHRDVQPAAAYLCEQSCPGIMR